jgi:RNA polymerase sigma-70 factor (ECF subfamily)
MPDVTLSDIERLGALDEADRTFQMDEEAFRAFYELTAKSLHAYLCRALGDSRAADDLLQETYYRFLRTPRSFDSDNHRRNYLFRIASNLIVDDRRVPRRATVDVEHADGADATPRQPDVAERATTKIDLARAMDRLSRRERSLLWLAYAQGWSHQEIAVALGLKRASLKTLLFRARRHLVRLLTTSRGGRT